MRMLVAAMLLFTTLAWSGPEAQTTPVAVVKLAGLDVKSSDWTFTPKDGYVHAILDLIPYKEAMAKSGLKQEKLAQALLDGPLAEKYPDAVKVKLVLLEYPERDNYGAPRWDKVKVVARYEASKKKKSFVLKAAKK